MRTALGEKRHRSRNVIRISVIFGLLTALGPVEQAVAHGWDHARACKTTATLVRRAAFAEASSDYWLALARASTLPDSEDRKAAQREARDEFREDLELAREQYEARLELCEWLDESQDHPIIDPEDFLTPEEIAAAPNSYFPLKPGTIFRYQGETEDGTERNEVQVTDDTREILGVTCVVVIDIEYLNDELKEYTWDWYAQDRDGNVWYFGELSLNYEDGELADIEGSWEAGVDGAQPGILMKAAPQVGEVYRQEFALANAEDAAQVLSLNESVAVPYGAFDGCLMTGEFTPIEPETLETFEHKFYAPGVGLLLEVDPESGQRHELIDIIEETDPE